MALPLSVIEGKYEVLAKIHEGGMGAIYKVRHRFLDELRVVKVILPKFEDKSTLQRRFRREARAAVRLRHPNIAQLYDFEVDESTGNSFIIQEFIDGLNLRQMLEAEGVPSVDLVLEIARQGLRAAQYLHEHQYVHRDISADNLMLTQDHTKEPLVKLIDLGIVKELGGETFAIGNDFIGKVRYASPEMFQNPHGIDRRSDLYSFGVLLYELLTGQFPLTGNTFVAIAKAHINQPPIPFDTSDPDHRVPDDVRACVMRALEKNAEDRMSSAEEFLSLLPEPRSQTLAPALEQTMGQTLTGVRLDDISSGRGSTAGAALGEVFPAGRRSAPGLSVPGSEAINGEPASGDIGDSVAAMPSEEDEKEKQREEEIAQRAISVEEDLSRGNLEEASARLDGARVDLGDAARFVELEAKLLDLRREIEVERREVAIAEALTEVRQAVQLERLDEAEPSLLAAREMLGDDARFDALDAEIASLRELLAERALREELERERAIEAAAVEVDALIAERRPDDARVALGAARDELGTAAAFEDLESRIEELQRLLEEELRRKRIVHMVTDAQHLALKGGRNTVSNIQALPDPSNLEASVARLEEAVELDPEDRHLRALLGELQAELDSRKRQKAVEEVRPRLEDRLLEEDVEGASELVAVLRGDFGDFPEITELADRVAALATELEQRRLREKEAKAVEAVSVTIEGLAQRGGLWLWWAEKKLSLALSRYGDQARLRQLGVEIDELRAPGAKGPKPVLVGFAAVLLLLLLIVLLVVLAT